MGQTHLIKWSVPFRASLGVFPLWKTKKAPPEEQTKTAGLKYANSLLKTTSYEQTEDVRECHNLRQGPTPHR